ncbi:SARP family transcriptional regulator [Sphaerotilus hippei]|uniref:SARP family transcriptional regulator n=1 Tax=Sphaerotilus hippei TaxID=744406 RepID=A0A318GW99_9BURK|nr:BTAD domain-containing putative transcriptional regulator [Sphaerotilus hippei]PXW92856.1 SARP family transcriptional regulator [Sphaerotilus hippei]
MEKLSGGRASIHVHLLGPPRWLGLDGGERRLSAKDAALVAVLALDGPQHRDHLAALLWPNVSLSTARSSLRQRAFRLKRAAGGEFVVADEFIRLAPEVLVDVHVTLSSDSGLLTSLTSDLLSGLESTAPDLRSEWLLTRRERFATERRDAVTHRANRCEREGNVAQAITWMKLLIDADPLSECAWRRLMQLHSARGDRTAALATYDRLERLIRDELGTHPDEETMELMRSIDAMGRTDAVNGLLSRSSSIPERLKHPPRLVGRQDVLADVRNAWACDRLAWIEGPIGSGRTRLLEALSTTTGVLRWQLLMRDGSRPSATVARFVKQLLHWPASTADGSSPDSVETAIRRDAPAVLMEALTAAMAAGLTTVLIDDLQHADPDSLDGLARALPPMLQRGLRLAVTVPSTTEDTRLAVIRNSLASRHDVVHVNLPMLNAAQMAELLDAIDGNGESSRLLAADLMAHTGGNPWFALETLKAMHLQRWSEAGFSGLSPRLVAVVPAVVLDACRLALEALTPLQMAIARLVSTLEEGFNLERAAELLGCAPMDLIDAWVVLERRGICRGDRCSSYLMQQAIRSLMPEMLANQLEGMTRQVRTRSMNGRPGS